MVKLKKENIQFWNIDKTQVVWIGSKFGSDERYCRKYKLNYKNSDFVAQGITFSADISDIVMINSNTKLDKIRKDILQWYKRNLTTLGKTPW